MNEIDDLYKQESEDIDMNFLETMQNSKSKKNVLNDYISELRKSRRKFEEKYIKHLENEKKKIWNKKPKKEKVEEFKHLEIKKFDFEYTRFQKFKLRLSVFFFSLDRFISRFFVKIIPRLLIYLYYKLTKGVSFYFRAFAYWSRNKRSKIKSKFKRFFVRLFAKLKENYEKFVKLSKNLASKITFWKKKKGEEDSEGNGEEEKSNGKEKEDEK